MGIPSCRGWSIIANRIALDTGAVKTGVLSCLVLEGAETALLTDRPEPLPVGAGLEGEGLAEPLGADGVPFWVMLR